MPFVKQRVPNGQILLIESISSRYCFILLLWYPSDYVTGHCTHHRFQSTQSTFSERADIAMLCKVYMWVERRRVLNWISRPGALPLRNHRVINSAHVKATTIELGFWPLRRAWHVH